MALVAFDFDGTLSKSDMTVLLGEAAGVGSEVSGLVDQGLRGETTFEENLRQRVSLLEGMPERDVEAAFERVRLRKGAPELIADLRRSGTTVAIVTGSFDRGVEGALDRVGVAVDHLVANRLVVENEALTGEVEGPLVAGKKDEALREIVAEEGTTLDQTIAVGDGSSDLPMLKIAGTALGFSPVPVVEEYCDRIVSSTDRLKLYFQQHGMIDP